MAKELVITVTVPEGCKPGDTFEYIYTPVARQTLGSRPLEEMTDLEMFRYKRSLQSAISTAKTTGKTEIFDAKSAILAEVEEEMAKRGI